MGGKHSVGYQAQYYQDNKEHLKEKRRKHYKDNSQAILERERIANLNRTPEQVAADKKYHDQYSLEHKEEFSRRAKEKYKENAEEIKSRVHKRYANLPQETRGAMCRAAVLRKFHTTEEWYSARLAEQDGHCALCAREREENGNRLAIDHDHECCGGTGSCGNCLRGLLCRGCNVRLGTLIAILSVGLILGIGHTGWAAKAVGYLEKYKSQVSWEA